MKFDKLKMRIISSQKLIREQFYYVLFKLCLGRIWCI